MKDCVLKIDLNGEETTVFVTAKSVKKFNLRVKIDKIELNVPKYASKKDVVEFLLSNKDWLHNAVQKMRTKDNFDIKNQVKYLGKVYDLVILEGKKKVIVTEDKFLVFVPDTDRETAKKVFIKWWKERTKDYFSAMTEREFLRCGSFLGISILPKTTISKVKSYWGKCFYTKKEIRYSFYLLQADERACRYIVCHELAHFRHHDHSRSFYDTLRAINSDTDYYKKYNVDCPNMMWVDF